MKKDQIVPVYRERAALREVVNGNKGRSGVSYKSIPLEHWTFEVFLSQPPDVGNCPTEQVEYFPLLEIRHKLALRYSARNPPDDIQRSAEGGRLNHSAKATPWHPGGSPRRNRSGPFSRILDIPSEQELRCAVLLAIQLSKDISGGKNDNAQWRGGPLRRIARPSEPSGASRAHLSPPASWSQKRTGSTSQSYVCDDKCICSGIMHVWRRMERQTFIVLISRLVAPRAPLSPGRHFVDP